jgi:hypothetical protein
MEIRFNTHTDGDLVLSQMEGLIAKYGQATVADLYALSDLLPNSYSNEQMGWTSLIGAKVVTVDDYFELRFPEPVTLPVKTDLRPATKTHTVKFSHEMPIDLAEKLDGMAARMGVSRRGLMNVLLYQLTEKA